MPGTHDTGAAPRPPTLYQIRLKGRLGRQWETWFGEVTTATDTNGDTLLTGPVPDQAALHGLLKKVRDLGLTLLSVTTVSADDNDSQPKASEQGDLP